MWFTGPAGYQLNLLTEKMPRRNYLSKIQVDKASHMLLDYYGHNATSILNTIRGQMLSETHICKSIPRQEICNQITTNTSVCSDMVARYSELYQQCNTGKPSDRYALLQIQWIQHVSKYITDHTKENALLKTTLGNNSHSNQDVRAVIHSLASHICDHIQGFMLCIKPSKLRDLNDTFPKTDSRESLLAFGGACMRLIYISAKRKGDMDMMKLIQNLKLTREQRTLYISWDILSKRSSLQTLHTIPVPALLPYLTLLNGAIQESCTETALALFMDNFIKVINWGPVMPYGDKDMGQHWPR